MTAPAARRDSPPLASFTSFPLRLALCLALWPAAPVAARVGASLAAFSDSRFRGYSLSESRPVGIFDFAYDDPSGFYTDASVTGVVRHSGEPAPLGAELSGGYAKRLSSGTTLDFGAVYSGYSHYSLGETAKSYAELYAGIARGGLSSRLFLSPHYSRAGLWTAYGEVDGSMSPDRHWSLDAHAGMLVPLRAPAGPERFHTAFDFSAGVTRDLGRLSLHASVVGGLRGRDYYGARVRGAPGVVVGASWAL